MNASLNTPAVMHEASTTPLRALYACACLLLMLMVVGDASVLFNLRESALRSKQANSGTVSLTLAEQADRSMQGIDLVLGSLADQFARDGVTDPASFAAKLSGHETHIQLLEKLTGLPYINAIALISVDGRLINFSRYWPIPDIGLGDRSYFKAMIADPQLSHYVSDPVINRGDGVRTVYLARRVNGPDGKFAGLLLGAVDLQYFEDLYRSVSLGRDSTITLLRDDGVLFARYPPASAAVGQRFPDFQAPPPDAPLVTVTRGASPIDGLMRIKAASRLPNFPMFVQVTMTEASALAEWRNVAWTLGLITATCVMSIIIATLATARGWRHQRLVGLERAERAEAERARALSETELAREREQNAEKASKAKSSFLAMMSHEIRTPMNAVLGLAGTLLDETLSPPQRRSVEAIRDSGDSLLRILNDILDFSKLDAGRMTLEDTPFSPATLTHNIVSILGPRATAKGLAIGATCDPSLPDALLGDAGRIRQILLNLVSNALKFTEYGTVAIEALSVGQAAGTASVEWVVSDTGIGIAADQIRSLFGEFIQMDNSIHRRFGGSGLGLAICKRLTDQMGGTISVTSTLGQGTIFRVRLTLPLSDRLPDEPTPTVDVATRFQALRRHLGRPLRVLFAEDNPTNQFVALQLLKGLDIQVDVVGDGLEAIDAASSFLYDAIFMDVRMPDMDGMTATRLIRQRGGHLARIPIIALTANAFPEDVQACFAAGMNRFVPKPVNKEMLLSALVAAMNDQPPLDDARQSESGRTRPVPLDMAALEEMIEAIGDDGVAEMVSMFERETRDRLARLADLADEPLVQDREVHTLKGAATTVCAPALADLAVAIELRLKRGGALAPADVAALNEAFCDWLAAVQARLPEITGAG